ncbi:hypothetical protein SCHPADRAFT_895666 [Schizopora paradoxa]|uniref:Uncharacterized protein n=1 Tax=Schizopora paradoxa TaxID=27342 RepID=A0A0H2R4C7_9AGAM|nr:hypothetical protein SCHPADRAFT_895666 [Schizopora paradoxa]
MSEDVPFNFRVLSAVVSTISVAESFPDKLHIGVFPKDFDGYRVYEVPAWRTSTGMQVYLVGYLPYHHRALRFGNSSPLTYSKFTALYETTSDARPNSFLVNMTGDNRWKGDVIVLKHAGSDDHHFENITKEDLQKVMDILKEAPKFVKDYK